MPATHSSSSLLFTLLALVVATIYLESCRAFVIVTPSRSSPVAIPTSACSQVAPAFGTRHSIFALQAEADSSSSAEGGEAEEAVAEGEAAEGEEEAEKKEEDPEVAALKEQIADLEKTLKEKKSQVQYLKDSSETYSKTGYARKVAEMENMRRTRSSMASSNKETSIANVLRSFLPVKDQLEMLNNKYQDDEFGKNYGALHGNFNTAFTEMGVTEYTATVGEKIDRTRMLVVEEKYSPDHPKDTVLEPLKMGLELKGNVIILAECVASLGDESSSEEDDGSEEESDDADAGEETAEEA